MSTDENPGSHITQEKQIYVVVINQSMMLTQWVEPGYCVLAGAIASASTESTCTLDILASSSNHACNLLEPGWKFAGGMYTLEEFVTTTNVL